VIDVYVNENKNGSLEIEGQQKAFYVLSMDAFDISHEIIAWIGCVYVVYHVFIKY